LNTDHAFATAESENQAPQPMEASDIRRVLVLGAGTMGQQIGYVCALHGLDVCMYDVSGDALDAAAARIERRASKMGIYSHASDSAAVSAALARIQYCTDPAQASEGADLVSESVPEDPELKGRVFGQFNNLCPARTLFTTNTSSLLPSQFAAATGRPEQFCALHFHDMSLTRIVDVMPHPGTAPQTTRVVTDFARRIGQVPIVLAREHNGYVFNTMLMALLSLALKLAANGVAAIPDIDRAFMGVMHTVVGPFGIMDSIGIDTAWKITDYWARRKDDPQEAKNAAFLKDLVDRGALGTKSGQGFYTYPHPEFMGPGFIAGER